MTISPPFNPLYWWDQGLKTVRWTRKILNSARSLWLFKEPLKIPSWLPWGKDFSSKSYLQMAENGKPILPIWCHSKCWSQCLICQKNEKNTHLEEVNKVTRKSEIRSNWQRFHQFYTMSRNLGRFRYNKVFHQDLSLAFKYCNEGRPRHGYSRSETVIEVLGYLIPWKPGKCALIGVTN